MEVQYLLFPTMVTHNPGSDSQKRIALWGTFGVRLNTGGARRRSAGTWDARWQFRSRRIPVLVRLAGSPSRRKQCVGVTEFM